MEEQRTKQLKIMTAREIEGGETAPDYPFGNPEILNNIVDSRAERTPRALYAEISYFDHWLRGRVQKDHL